MMKAVDLSRLALTTTIVLISCGLAQTQVASAKVTLHVAHAWPSVRLPAQLEFDKRFMQRHPDIVIKCENVDWGTFRDKLLGRFAAGNAPDVMYTLGGWAQLWIKKGLFRDLTPYIRSTRDFNLSDFNIEGTKKYQYQGKFYALPYAWSPMPIYWNKTLFKQAGVEYPDYTSFDYDKLLELTKKLTKDTNGDGKPDLFGLEHVWSGGWSSSILFKAFGGSILSADEQTITANDPKALSSLQWWSDLKLKHGVTGSGFTGGKIAMTMTYGSWDTGAIHSQVKNKFDWDMGHWPKSQVGRYVVAESSGYGITKATKHPKEAWLYLNEYLSTEGQKQMRDAFGSDVSRKSARSLEVPGDVSRPISMKILFEMIDDYAFDAPANPAMDYVWPLLSRELGNISGGKKSVPQAMEAFKKEGDIILRTRKIR